MEHVPMISVCSSFDYEIAMTLIKKLQEAKQYFIANGIF